MRRRLTERRRTARRGGRRAVGGPPRPLPNVPLLVAALGGFAIAGFLTLAGLLDSGLAGCEPGSGCDLVGASRFSSLLGVPTAAWGVALYAVLAAVALFVRDARLHTRLALAASGAGVAASLYLTAISFIVLGDVCAWCIASLGAVTACFGIALAQAARGEALRRDLAVVAAGSALFVAALHVYYHERLVAKDEAVTLRALALHLDTSGARFYGASWCDACTAQKDLFAEAASVLPYVECSPSGRRGPQAPECRKERIERYPTWVVGDHRHEGLLEVEKLAALSRFDEARAATETLEATEGHRSRPGGPPLTP